MAQEGCQANTVRGGGCYFGPSVTEQLLQKYNLQFLIRSHEHKPEGYGFCHRRKVGTVCVVPGSGPRHPQVGTSAGSWLPTASRGSCVLPALSRWRGPL